MFTVKKKMLILLIAVLAILGCVTIPYLVLVDNGYKEQENNNVIDEEFGTENKFLDIAYKELKKNGYGQVGIYFYDKINLFSILVEDNKFLEENREKIKSLIKNKMSEEDIENVSVKFKTAENINNHKESIFIHEQILKVVLEVLNQKGVQFNNIGTEDFIKESVPQIHIDISTNETKRNFSAIEEEIEKRIADNILNGTNIITNVEIKNIRNN